MEQSNLGTFDGGDDGGTGDGEEVSVLKVNYTIESDDEGPRPVVHVFGRAENGEKRHVRVRGFEPYFCAPTDEVDSPTDDERVVGTDTGYESIDGDGLTRLYTRIPPDVSEVRDEYTHYEADILFPDRFRIDKGVKSGMHVKTDGEGVAEIDAADVEPCDADAPARTCVLDIEVDDRNGFPEDGEEPIICLTAWDSFDDEYHVFVWDVDENEVEADDYTLRAYDDEETMLDGFLGYLDDRDPDVLTGWNCLPGDTEVSMADGSRKQIRDVEEGDTVFGEEDGETTVAEVSNRWVSERSVYEFKLADNGTLRTSGEHRVMVGDEDSVGWKRGEDIEEGDYVLKPRSLNVEETHVPTLSELVPDHKQKQAKQEDVKSFKKGLPRGGVSELAGEFGVSEETLYHPCPTVWNKKRMRRAKRRYGVAVPDGGWRYKGTDRELDRELTEDEVYLAGLVITDGTMSEKDGVRFYNTRKELHDAFPGDNTLRPDGKGCYAQSVLDYARMRAFGGLGIPFGDKNEADVDLSAVFQMPEGYVARFLAGVIDGDGCVTSDVTVSAANPSARDWYVRLFRRVGVYAEECGEVVRVPDSERELDVLKEKVLPHMRHTEKKELLEGLEGGKSGRTENVPFALFEAEVGSYERRVGRDKHRRGVSLKRHDTSADGWEGFVFVEVEEVNEAGVEATYDIETTTSNFFAEDCLVHNCNDFDFPYIIDRLDELNMDPNRLARVGDVWHDDWGGPTVKGRATFDLLYAYQRMNFTELESYRLDAIAEEELGESKVTYTGKIGDLWEDDPDRLLEYNKMDVELCVRIDEKVGIIDFFRELSRFVGCSLEDATTPSDVVDVYVLRKAHGEFVLPSKRGGGGGEEYEGGEVFEPITGIRENVAVLDLASLYPMSMISVNASPETKVGDGYDGETYDVEMSGGDVVRFRKEPEGLTKSIVTELLEERDKKKAARDEHEIGSEEYEKYDDQQNAIKVVMNCFDGETEVVGEDGVKRIDEVGVGEMLYTVDPETGEVETKRVVETQEYDYDGEMVDVETRYVDFSVTPNHRMLVETGDGENEFVEAGDLNDHTSYEIPNGEAVEGREPETFSLLEEGEAGNAYLYTDGHGRSNRSAAGDAADALEYEPDRGAYKTSPEHVSENPVMTGESDEVLVQKGAKGSSVPAEYGMSDWLRLVGWYVAEGSVYETGRGRSKKVQLGRLDDEGRERTVSLLERIGLNPLEEERRISFRNAVVADWLSDNCGAASDEKRLPEFVFELDASLLEHLFDALVRGGGDRHSGVRYSTKSDSLKEDVVRLAVHLGYKPLVNRDSGVWRVRFSDNEGAFRMHRNGGRSESDGRVYCVTVKDNHTVLAGRNGRFQWVGQSYYGVAGYPRFRLYDREMGRAVTATGRAVIEHTRDAVEEEGYEVVYGDTDSTLVELGEGSLDTLVERGETLESVVNESYDGFAVERFNAHEHRWEIEFEKLYERFFQAGRKKRYAGKLVWKDGKGLDEPDLDITGFEYKRSDVSEVTKEVQQEVIERILDGAGFDEVSEYVRGVVDRFKSGEFGYGEVGVPGGIGQKLDSYETDTAQVTGAKYANEHLGTNFTSGSKPKRLYVKRVKGDYPPTDVVCFEYPEQVPEEFEVDREKMLEKTVRNPIERILEALGWSWSEVVNGQRQQGLGSFT